MSKKEEDLSFEEAMKKLEDIANCLEKGELSLDDSVSKFEEGMELSKKCNEILKSAENKITILVKDGEKIIEEDFNSENE